MSDIGLFVENKVRSFLSARVIKEKEKSSIFFKALLENLIPPLLNVDYKRRLGFVPRLICDLIVILLDARMKESNDQKYIFMRDYTLLKTRMLKTRDAMATPSAASTRTKLIRCQKAFGSSAFEI